MRTFRNMARRWLFPPAFEGEERAHAARILYTVLAFGLGNSLLLCGDALAQPELARRMLGFGGFSLASTSGCWR
jgi:hypothetical protein